MQRRLTYAGMRPISNIVDITNYVMLEWGQPLHAFDYDKLLERAAGKTPIITVRPARAGEVLITLDSNKRELTPDNLVIADAAGPIALAGVMGGLDTEVTEATRNVLLESANFNFVSIRRTMKALNLPSEASLDPGPVHFGRIGDETEREDAIADFGGETDVGLRAAAQPDRDIRVHVEDGLERLADAHRPGTGVGKRNLLP